MSLGDREVLRIPYFNKQDVDNGTTNHLFLSELIAIPRSIIWLQIDATMDSVFFWTIPCFCFLGTCHAGCLSGPGTCCAQHQALKSWSHLLFALLVVKALPLPNLLVLPHMPPSNLTFSRKPSLPPRLSCSHLFKAELVLYILCHIINHLAITYVNFFKDCFLFFPGNGG